MMKDKYQIILTEGDSCKECVFNQLCDILSNISDKGIFEIINNWVPSCDRDRIWKTV